MCFTFGGDFLKRLPFPYRETNPGIRRVKLKRCSSCGLLLPSDSKASFNALVWTEGLSGFRQVSVKKPSIASIS